MTSDYSIVFARERDVERLAAIELAAARLLTGHAPDSVLRETTDMTTFRRAAREGHLWVALHGDKPVGFALVKMLATDLPHLDEIDVEPSHGRRGPGTRLVHAVCDWATAADFLQLTLTTFRAVPWNMPFHARLAFAELPLEAWRPELAAVVAREAARGLRAETRVTMAYTCSRS
jgi:GNAT superfamily N-acetyltransferase